MVKLSSEAETQQTLYIEPMLIFMLSQRWKSTSNRYVVNVSCFAGNFEFYLQA